MISQQGAGDISIIVGFFNFNRTHGHSPNWGYAENLNFSPLSDCRPAFLEHKACLGLVSYRDAVTRVPLL